MQAFLGNLIDTGARKLDRLSLFALFLLSNSKLTILFPVLQKTTCCTLPFLSALFPVGHTDLLQPFPSPFSFISATKTSQGMSKVCYLPFPFSSPIIIYQTDIQFVADPDCGLSLLSIPISRSLSKS